MGNLEGLAAQAVEEVAGNGFARGKTNGVHKAVKLAPGVAQALEHGVDLRVVGHVAVKDQGGVELGSKFSDAALEAFAHIAESQLGALFVAGLGNAIGDRAVGQNACDQQLFTGEKTHCCSPKK